MHSSHGVRRGGIAFLNAVDGLALLSEDIGVLGWWEDAVEVGLVEAFADLEDGLCGGGGRRMRLRSGRCAQQVRTCGGGRCGVVRFCLSMSTRLSIVLCMRR